MATRAAASISSSFRLLRLRWRLLLPQRWRQREAQHGASTPAVPDRTRESIALGVAMAEAEAIWKLRQWAMRWAADHPERLARQAARDAEAGSS